MTERLATWDVREPGWGDKREARHAWLKENGLPASQIYRAEFWFAAPPFARIFCYALDAEGRKHWAPGHVQGPHDHDRCEPAREEPRDVPLDALPPEELW